MSKIGVVLGRFHHGHVSEMLDTVRRGAAERGVEILHEVWVPGSMEKPLAVKRLLLKDAVDGVVALGIIERGETKHGLVMGQSVIAALIQLQLEFMKPVGIGIIGPEVQPSQIPSRVVPHAAAALAAVCAMLE